MKRPLFINKKNPDDMVEITKIQFVAQGGGFVKHSNTPGLIRRFLDEYRPFTEADIRWKRMNFELEGCDFVLKGWTNGERWNGWQVPHVEESELWRLSAWFASLREEDPEIWDQCTTTFMKNDCWWVRAFDGLEHEEFEMCNNLALISPHEGHELNLFEVGLGYCWSEHREIEVVSFPRLMELAKAAVGAANNPDGDLDLAANRYFEHLAYWLDISDGDRLQEWLFTVTIEESVGYTLALCVAESSQEGVGMILEGVQEAMQLAREIWPRDGDPLEQHHGLPRLGRSG